MQGNSAGRWTEIMSSQRKKNAHFEAELGVSNLPSRGARGRNKINIGSPHQEVICLTITQEVLCIYLPYGLHPEQAVLTVDDILEVSGVLV